MISICDMEMVLTLRTGLPTLDAVYSTIFCFDLIIWCANFFDDCSTYFSFLCSISTSHFVWKLKQMWDELTAATGRNFNRSAIPLQHRDATPKGPFTNQFLRTDAAPRCGPADTWCQIFKISAEYYELSKILEASLLADSVTGHCYTSSSPVQRHFEII